MKLALGLIVPFVGGKRQLLSKILPVLPPHRNYVEAFGGGAAILLSKPVAPGRTVLNDLDPAITGFYRRFSCRALEPCRKIRDVCAFAKGARQRVRAGSPNVCDQVAARRFSIVSDIHGGMKTEECKTRPIVTRQLEKHCGDFERRLRGAIITNLDFRRAFALYDGPDTLTFADPPYPGTTPPSRFKANGVSPKDVCELARQAKGKVLVTYNDVPAVRAACTGRGLTVREIPSVHRSKHVTRGDPRTRELLIANFKLPAQVAGR